MFGGPLVPPAAAAQQRLPAMTPLSLLQSISDRAASTPDSGYSSPAPSTSAQAAAIAATPPGPLAGQPCRIIEPVLEKLAREKAKRGGEGQVAFAKVDLGVGMGFRGLLHVSLIVVSFSQRYLLLPLVSKGGFFWRQTNEHARLRRLAQQTDERGMLFSR